ncbi:MAG: DivIVA domain-containing protein, partial [Actinomycetota bacterium]|nr:DivIVA domain-containing protein [Actinomycetota bacterium]MDA3011858.1 DivIVA domain-containing protein [Actinomycetota bacterium]MDA3024580.1 DivIVA domain-containing protein [Actinomycetota bacterium]
MAISFSRPDPSSPSAVAGASFPTTRRGFDQSEVRDFLRMVSAELSRLQERERFLERELTNQQGVSVVPGDLDEDRLAELLGEETARIIQAAREAGAKLRHRAEETAQRLIRDATEDSARIREEADLEAARVRQDAMADAESEIMMAKQQGRDMVDEARAYRERVLADISRRRELAREQIEDLYHGRERLIQAFERARVATDDVLSDLEDAADEPSGFVNLANSTGPVPLVVQDDPVVYDQDSDDEGDSRVIRHPSIDQPEVADAVVEETVPDSPVVDTIVDEVADEATEESSVEVVVDQVVDNVVETPEPVSNVVQLFGKAEPIVDEVDDHDVADLDDVDEPIVDEPVRAPRAARPTASTDDIFAKLRRASAEMVAKDANREASNKATPSEAKEPKTPSVPVARSIAETVGTVSTFESRDEILVPLILTMGRKAKRVLADEQNQILDVLRAKKPVKTLDAIVGPKTDHTKRYCTALSASIKSAAVAGARSMQTSESKATDRELGEMVKGQLKAVDEIVVTSIVEPLRERLSRSISQSSDNAELSKLVRTLFREWKTQFIDEQIDDLAYAAYGRGALAALTPGTKVCWKYDPAGPACPDAEDNSLAGAIDAGEAFPTGHTHAPA